ncbi:MAG: DUF302 domain-containing protein [Acidimicrobiales bacterium]
MRSEHEGVNEGIVSKVSRRSVSDTVARLTELVIARGMKVFSVNDQRAEARAVGLELRETTIVTFGNPKAGTPVMAAAPLAALELPLKALVWADGEQTMLSYWAPKSIAERYNLSAALAARLVGVHALTDAVVGDD